MDPQLISNAILIWTGRQTARSPLRDDALVLGHYGDVEGGRLLEEIYTLQNDFYRSDAHLTVSDLADMGRKSAAEFRALHPELPHEVADAFAWCYTFDYK